MRLCSNCLETNGKDRELGPTKGSQMDPYQETICLCASCWEYLYKSDLKNFHDSYRETRNITRE